MNNRVANRNMLVASYKRAGFDAAMRRLYIEQVTLKAAAWDLPALKTPNPLLINRAVDRVISNVAINDENFAAFKAFCEIKRDGTPALLADIVAFGVYSSEYSRRFAALLPRAVSPVTPDVVTLTATRIRNMGPSHGYQLMAGDMLFQHLLDGNPPGSESKPSHPGENPLLRRFGLTGRKPN